MQAKQTHICKTKCMPINEALVMAFDTYTEEDQLRTAQDRRSQIHLQHGTSP